jgi:hypothetical protein
MELKQPDERFKKVLLAIGILLALAFFTGFFAWQIADTFTPMPIVKDCYSSECANYQIAFSSCYSKCDPNNPACAQSNCSTSQVQLQNCTTSCENNNAQLRTKIDQQTKQHRLIFAIITLIIGAVSIIGGILIVGYGAVSGGLIGGGIVCTLEAIVAYWTWMGGWFRVFTLFILLVVLILVGIRKLKD